MNGRRCVVVGEVLEPRSVNDREALRASLEAGIERANEALREQLVAPFSVLRGVEEIGGASPIPSGPIGHYGKSLKRSSRSRCALRSSTGG
ncbi:hypothetical protein ACFQER_05590 [Halomicroarcula sp. GCM10025894]|uniref:hypothetical protein n=1 Tax=Halomicroarcula sp. GCM10025894 TaxID=3252673 RepID=UPI0036142AEA